MKPGRALITGASGGIGAELARLHAAEGGDLVLAARRQSELEAMKRELETAHGINAQVIVADLTEPDAVQRVHAEAGDIDILINNAGFGSLGTFQEQSPERHRSMIALNISALTELTHLYLPRMIKKGSGRILNVSSTASMLPGPYNAVYFATKAYVTSFSLALAEETKGTGVTVTALCPGPVETGFWDASNMQNAAMRKRAISSDKTAKAGYRAMMRGDLVVFDDWRLRLALGWVVPFLPRRLVLWAARRAMQTV